MAETATKTIDRVTVEIDGQELAAPPGCMIIEVADAAGIYIPRFCYHHKLSVAANCRMCLVEVERAPKPLPACATPVMEGMKVQTMSANAVAAQKDTLEFLLINHPLDCPICDQGGECPLQDHSMGYGGHRSRFDEKKRVVADHDIGPLIATEMTRCIHCTRCVRFGEEVGGVMEFGITGRGEHLKIDTFLHGAVNSEVSGNVIDLCPVGALTSKPYRFAARSWELISHDAVSPHDCLGTNIAVQTLRNEVKRVLPRDNDSINECWIADRDRFSYDALIGNNRLVQPQMRTLSGALAPVPWSQALAAAVEGFRKIIDTQGASQLGALISPLATFEEFYLLQKLMRSLGCPNVDHRLRQIDFSADDSAPMYPGSKFSIASFASLKSVFLIGSNIRKEQPLLGVRIRKAVNTGAAVATLSPMDWEQNFPIDASIHVTPSLMPYALARVLQAVCEFRQVELPTDISEKFLSGAEDFPLNDECRKTARLLCECGGTRAIVLGQTVLSHSMYSCIERLAVHLSRLTEAALVTLPPANSAAAWVAGCIPHREHNAGTTAAIGLNARQMVHNRRAGYLLFDVEPDKDMADGLHAHDAIRKADFVVSLQWHDEIPDYVDVALPIAPFTENTGTMINYEGVIQQSMAAAPPRGESRPGWKILRVLGNLFELPGFDYITTQDIVAQASPMQGVAGYRPVEADQNQIPCAQTASVRTPGRYELVSDPLIYSTDSIVRRCRPLQETADAAQTQIRLHPEDANALGIEDGAAVTLCHELHCIHGTAATDRRVVPGCVCFPAGVACAPSAAMGAEVRVEPRERI